MLFFCIPHLSTWATELWRWFTMRPIDTKRLCGPRPSWLVHVPTAAPPHLPGVQGGPTSWWHRGGWGSTWKVDKLSRWIRWMLRAQVFRMAPLVKSPRTGNYKTNMSLFDILYIFLLVNPPWSHHFFIGQSTDAKRRESRLHRHVAGAVHGEGDQRSPGAAQGSQGVAGWEDSPPKKAPKGWHIECV